MDFPGLIHSLSLRFRLAHPYGGKISLSVQILPFLKLCLSAIGV